MMTKRSPGDAVSNTEIRPVGCMVEVLNHWTHLGSETLASGTRRIGHVPSYSPDAYLHQLYAPLDEAQLKQMERALRVELPDVLTSFYTTMNGLSMFFDSLSIYGYRPVLEYDSPYDIRLLNNLERPKDALPHHLFLGTADQSYDFRSLMYMDLKTLCLYTCAGPGSVAPAASWDSLEAMLISEYERLAPFFDEQGCDTRQFAGDLSIDDLRRRGRTEVREDGTVELYLKKDLGHEIDYGEELDLIIGKIDPEGRFQPKRKDYEKLRGLVRNDLHHFIRQKEFKGPTDYIPPKFLLKFLYKGSAHHDWEKVYKMFKYRSKPLGDVEEMSLERLREGEVFIDDDGNVGVYVLTDFLSKKDGPHLFIGKLDEEGQFHPSKAKYEGMTAWLRDEVRRMVEFMIKEDMSSLAQLSWMKFVYGDDLWNLWRWDEEAYRWRRIGNSS